MKYPLLCFTAAFAGIIAVLIKVSFKLLPFLQKFWLLLVIAGILLLFCGIRWRTTRFLWAITTGAICGMSLLSVYQTHFVLPIQQLANNEYTFSAEVIDYPDIYEQEQRVKIQVAAQTLGIQARYRPIKMLIYLPLTEKELKPGDEVSVTAQLYIPTISDGFDRQTYYAADGIFILGRYEKNEDTKQPIYFMQNPCAATPIRYFPLLCVQKLKNTVSTILPPRQAGFLNALLFGDKSGMEQHDRLMLKKAGLSHVTAVSGMHIGFLVGFLLLVFGKRAGSALSIIVILFFIPMAGASPSVIRAGIMYAMTSLGFLLNRESSNINNLGLALLILLSLNPYAIQSMSLILSFTSALGLAVFGTPCMNILMKPFDKLKKKPIRRIPYFICSSICCSLCVLIFTMPVLLISFGYVSLLAPLSNLLTISIIGFVFILGFLCSIIALFSSGIASILIGILLFGIHYILWIAEKVSSFPYGLLYEEHAALLFIIFYSFAALLFLSSRWKQLHRFLPIYLPVLIGLFCWNAWQQSTQVKMHILPSGAGQTIAIADAHKYLTLIDCSASGYRDAAENVTEMMEWYGYQKIDMLILTAVDLTHARSVPTLLQTQEIGQIIIPADVKESDLLTQILQGAETAHVPVRVWNTVEESVISQEMPFLTALGGVERKLAICVRFPEETILIVHSLTQKMLTAWLENHSIHADTLVLSERNISDGDALLDAIQRMGISQFILQSGYTDQDRMLQLPVRNTFLEGEIIIKRGEIS